jgi:hypothetical protein
MAQANSVAMLFINRAHTGGQDLASDIVVSDDVLEPLCHAVNDDGGLWDIDGEQRAFGTAWAWRKPRLRKG